MRSYSLPINFRARSFASRPTVHKSENVSASGIILRYSSLRKGYITKNIKDEASGVIKFSTLVFFAEFYKKVLLRGENF